MGTPMTPGSKSESLEDVIDLAWNNEGMFVTTILLNILIIIIIHLKMFLIIYLEI